MEVPFQVLRTIQHRGKISPISRWPRFQRMPAKQTHFACLPAATERVIGAMVDVLAEVGVRLLERTSSQRHCFSSAVQAEAGSLPFLAKASTMFFRSFETLLSKLLKGSDWPKAMEPVDTTAPSLGAVK